MKLRHAPLLLVREMARYATHRGLVAETLERVIQRADELSEFVAIYWATGRQPLSAQVKKGLAAAFGKFDEYALAKYDRAGAVRLRDVLFLCHARPVDEAQAALWKRLVDNELATPDTWEVALSAAGRGEAAEGDREVAKREVWERLLADRKLGALALLRNLRNLHQAGVSEELVLAALAEMKTDRVLPFRFLAAARVAPQWEQPLEFAMFRARSKRRTARLELLAIPCCWSTSPAPWRRRCRAVLRCAGPTQHTAWRFCCARSQRRSTIYTFSDHAKLVPSRRGMALRDALEASQPHSGTYLGKALTHVEAESRSWLRTADRHHRRAVPRQRACAARQGLRDQRSLKPQRCWLRCRGPTSTAGAKRWLITSPSSKPAWARLAFDRRHCPSTST